MKKKIPDFKDWEHGFLYCVRKEHSDLDDYRVLYVCGLSISPELSKRGPEYKQLADALKKEDGDFLAEYFSSIDFEEIQVTWGTPCKNKNPLEAVFHYPYFGEKWSVITDFDIKVFMDLKHGYLGNRLIDEKDSPYGVHPRPEQKYFYYLPQYSRSAINGLHLFNALSFENTTHLMRFYSIWKGLREIQDLLFHYDFDSMSEETEESYTKLYVPKKILWIDQALKGNPKPLLEKANELESFLTVNRNHYADAYEELKAAGVFREHYGFCKNAFEGFLRHILKAFMDEAIANEFVQRCDFCGAYFEYKEGKRYCSLKSEGKDCGSKIRDKRDYSKHKQKRIKAKKAWTQKTRKEIPGY
jgi:hypothetical protein